MGDVISVSVSFNHGYARPALVCLHSAVATLPRGCHAEIYAQVEGEPEWFESALRRSLAGSAASWALHRIPFDPARFAGARDPGRLSPLAYGRLLAAELGAQTKRILLIDVDTWVRESLLELWRADLGDAVVGAVTDWGMPTLPDHLVPHCPHAHDAGRPPKYFNSGVMLVDLAKWTALDVKARAMEFLLNHSELSFYADQCALNVALDGRWHDLPDRWNFQCAQYPSREPRAVKWQNAAIVHFQGNRKPWDPYFSRSAVSRAYFKAAAAVGIRGWRPGGLEYAAAAWQRHSPAFGYRLQQARKRLQRAIFTRRFGAS
jgi:lipopolysaccharide biosynthesis glycosyltransferase